jgi:hypothetical protein
VAAAGLRTIEHGLTFIAGSEVYDMAKLVRALVVLAVLVGGIAVAVHYSNRSKAKSAAVVSDNKPDTAQAEKKKPKEGMQVQEKYGFAPVGDGQ